MNETDEFGGIAVAEPDKDEFGGVAVTDEFGGVSEDAYLAKAHPLAPPPEATPEDVESLKRPWYQPPPEFQKSLIGISPEDIPSGANTTAPAVTIPISAAGKLGAGVAGYLTSPQGATEMALAATPAAPAIFTKWAYDMLKGAKASVEDATAQVGMLIRDAIAKKMVSANQLGIPEDNPEQTQEHIQALAEDAVNTAAMGLGGVGAAGHAISRAARLVPRPRISPEAPPPGGEIAPGRAGTPPTGESGPPEPTMPPRANAPSPQPPNAPAQEAPIPPEKLPQTMQEVLQSLILNSQVGRPEVRPGVSVEKVEAPVAPVKEIEQKHEQVKPSPFNQNVQEGEKLNQTPVVKESFPTEPVAIRLPPGDQTWIRDWPKAYEQTNDEYVRVKILEAVARRKSTPQEQSAVLDRVLKLEPVAGLTDNVIYSVSRNQSAGAEVQARAKALYDSDAGLPAPPTPEEIAEYEREEAAARAARKPTPTPLTPSEEAEMQRALMESQLESETYEKQPTQTSQTPAEPPNREAVRIGQRTAEGLSDSPDIGLWSELQANTREFNGRRTTKARKREIIDRQIELRKELANRGYDAKQIYGVEMLQSEMPPPGQIVSARGQIVSGREGDLEKPPETGQIPPDEGPTQTEANRPPGQLAGELAAPADELPPARGTPAEPGPTPEPEPVPPAERPAGQGEAVPSEEVADLPPLESPEELQRQLNDFLGQPDLEDKAVEKIAKRVRRVVAVVGQRPAREVKRELVSRLQQAIDEAPSEEAFKSEIKVKASRILPGATGRRKYSSPTDYPLSVIEADPDSFKVPTFRIRDAIAEYRLKHGDKIGKVEIDIPGDGTFKVWNTKEALQTVLDRAKRLSTSGAPEKNYTESLPSREQGRTWMKEAEVTPPPSGGQMRLLEKPTEYKATVEKVAPQAQTREPEASPTPDVSAEPAKLKISRVQDELKRYLKGNPAMGPLDADAKRDWLHEFGIKSHDTGRKLRYTYQLSDGRIVSADGALKLTNPEAYERIKAQFRSFSEDAARAEIFKAMPEEVQKQILDEIPYKELSELPTLMRDPYGEIQRYLTKEGHILGGKALGKSDAGKQVLNTVLELHYANEAKWTSGADAARAWRETNRNAADERLSVLRKGDKFTATIKDSPKDQILRKYGGWEDAKPQGHPTAQDLGVPGLKPKIGGRAGESGAVINPAELLKESDLPDRAKMVFRWGLDQRKRLVDRIARGGNRDVIAMAKDAADNIAQNTSKQAANLIRHELNRAFGVAPNKVRETRNALREMALTFAVEAGGERLDLGRMRSELTQANAEGINAIWKRRALKAIDFAEQNWDRLQPIVNQYKALTDWQNAFENSRGIRTLYRQGGYVFHLQDVDSTFGSPSTGNPSARGGAPAPFRHIRDHATYADAIASGVNPESLNAVDLLQRRIAMGQRLANYGAFMDGMERMVDPVTREPLIKPPETRQRADGTQDVTAPPGYTLTSFGGRDVALHNGYTGLFGDLTNPSWMQGTDLRKNFMQGIGLAKHGMLLFDSYHMGRLAFWNAVTRLGAPTYQRGFTLLDNHPSEIQRMAERGEIPQKWADNLLEQKRILNQGLKAGLNVGNVGDNLYTDFLQQIPGIGTFNKWLFEKYQRGAMAEVYLIEHARQSKMFPNDTPDQLARRVAKDVNTRFGNLQSQGWIKSRTGQDLARVIFLAPQWNESLIRAEAGALAQAARAPGQSIRAGRPAMGALARGVGTGMLGIFIANQIINMATRGHPTWDNKEEGIGAKISAWIPDAAGGPGFFLNPMSVPAEMTHLLLKGVERRGELTRHEAESQTERAKRVGGNVAESLADIVRSRLSSFGKFVNTAVSGQDVMGRQVGRLNALSEAAPLPISGGAVYRLGKEVVTGRNEEKYPGEFQKQVMQSAGIKTEQAPDSNRRIYDLAKDFQRSKGVPVSTTHEIPFYGELTAAVKRGNMKDANEALDKILTIAKGSGEPHTLEDVARYYSAYPKRSFTNNRAMERAFYASLNAEQQQAYQKAIAERQRIAVLVRQLLAQRAGR